MFDHRQLVVFVDGLQNQGIFDEREIGVFALGLPIVLIFSYLIALVMRWMFDRRLRLSTATLVIISVLGMSCGLLISALIFPKSELWMPPTWIFSFASSVVIALAVSSIFAGLHRKSEKIDIDELLAAGESEQLEFKETARWNIRTEKKDPRMELAIAKTIAAFLNSSGGTLLIGVNDQGEIVGLDRDFSTLRVPDSDRFELWLRDLLSTLLGRNAAAIPRVQFFRRAGSVVCCVTCTESPKPVFLTQSRDGTSK